MNFPALWASDSSAPHPMTCFCSRRKEVEIEPHVQSMQMGIFLSENQEAVPIPFIDLPRESMGFAVPSP
jgi:hypothetical protein